MTVSRYPRLTYPVIPSMLRDFLPPRLRALDERVWRSFDRHERRRVHEAIINSVRKELLLIRKQLGDKFLPVPPTGITLGDLELEVRTFNCLLGLGLSEDLQLIGCLRLKELLATKNFGARSLVDLLAALDSVEATSVPKVTKGNPKSPTPESTNIVSVGDIERIRNHVRRRESIPLEIRRRSIPKLPRDLRIGRHDLENRTYNCLRKAKLITHLEKLNGQTVGALLGLPGFGKNCLVDLLNVLELFIGSTESNKEYEAVFAQRLAAEAKLLENLPSAEMISGNDPRLGRLLRSIAPNAHNVVDAAEQVLSGSFQMSDPEALAVNIRRFIDHVQALSGMKLEEELLSMFVSNRQRDPEIVVRRFGLDGSPPTTLQGLGEQYGLTRERIRQVCDRGTRGVEGKRPFAPALDRALEMVTNSLPGIASEIEAALVTNDIAVTPFRLESLQKASRLLGREVPYSLSTIGEHRAAVADDLGHPSRKLLQIARRTVAHWGAVTLEDVVLKVRAKWSVPAPFVVRLVKDQADFRWLDEQGGWFWLVDVPRNRLLNQIRKVLSVTDAIGVSELRAGVRRHHRMQGFAPPERVLVELCKQLPGFSVDGRNINVDKDANWRNLLSETEKVMADILRAHGSVMQREPFEDECIAHGVNRTTFFAYLNYSPVITKYAIGVYGLRGSQVVPGIVESLKPRTTRSKVLKDYGWASEKRLWVGYRLSENALMTGVCSIPSALTKFIQGEFKLRSPDGIVVGNLSVNRIAAWGLRPFLSRKGVDIGDFLVMEFDLDSRIATIHVGDKTLLDEFQPKVKV